MINFSMVAYYSLNISEIIDKYCINKDRPALNCDGKCYLSQKLNALDNSSANSTQQNIPESFVLVFLNKTTNYYFGNLGQQIEKQKHYHITDNFKTISLRVNTPPPKFI
jgi:hypothetical protein